MYTMDRQEIKFVAGIRCYPGQAAPYEVPANLTWNAELGYAVLGDMPYAYDPNSGWLMDPKPAPTMTRTTVTSTMRSRATCSTRRRASATACRMSL